MNEQYLTVKEVAELRGCGERNIRMLIDKGEIMAETIKPDKRGPGRGGVQYRIPLSSLDDKLRLKHKRIIRKQKKAASEAENKDSKKELAPFNPEELTGSERKEISFWKNLLEEWHLYRETSGQSKGRADKAFVELMNVKNPKLNLNRRTLYRKWKALNETGEASLIDRRGKHGSHAKKLTSDIWDIFEAFYLDESRKSVSLCVTLTTLELERLMKEQKIEEMPTLPTIATFNREVNKIPIPYIEYFRHGRKSFIGKCEPYIKRMYENLEPNDIWVADNHTFDIMLHDGKKTLRLYLTAFMDVRTRKMMGWCVTDRPCSDATIYALRKGIERHGRPKMLYSDNGREFLFHDFGGNGFRRKKVAPENFRPPSILKELEIEFRTALPTNARAKGVERAFKTVKETFSKLFEAYTGGNVLERPERLKTVVKNPDKLKTVEEFIGHVDTYLEGWYNKRPHSGEGMDGMSPDEAFAELMVEKRTVTEAQLKLMFMRWSNPMRVGKNGVTLTFYGKKLQYFNQDLWMGYFGKEVYVRYSPDNLREVRIYDMEERFICTAALKEELAYNASKEAIAESQKQNRAAVKELSRRLADKGIKNHDALELMLDKATDNLDRDESINSKFIRPLFGGEVYAKAVGSHIEAEDDIDWTAALKRLKDERPDVEE